MLKTSCCVWMLMLALIACGQAEVPTVAIIPILNHSGDKWEALKTNQIQKATEYVRTELAKRGFSVFPEVQVKAKILDLKLDFADEENHRKAVMYDLAKALQADYVFFAVITHTSQKKQNRILYEDVEGEATAKVWLLQVKEETAIVGGKTFTARSGGNRMSFDNKGSDRQIQAAANVMRDALKSFFEAHPVKK
jgi:histidinol phosphatase-like enzyme